MGTFEIGKCKLYLKISYVFLVIFPIVSVILCYIMRSDLSGNPMLLSHCQWQISTFWKSLIYGIILIVVCMVLTIALPIIGALISMPLYLGLWAWCLYRAIKGFLQLEKDSSVGVRTVPA